MVIYDVERAFCLNGVDAASVDAALGFQEKLRGGGTLLERVYGFAEDTGQLRIEPGKARRLAWSGGDPAGTERVGFVEMAQAHREPTELPGAASETEQEVKLETWVGGCLVALELTEGVKGVRVQVV